MKNLEQMHAKLKRFTEMNGSSMFPFVTMVNYKKHSDKFHEHSFYIANARRSLLEEFERLDIEEKYENIKRLKMRYEAAFDLAQKACFASMEMDIYSDRYNQFYKCICMEEAVTQLLGAYEVLGRYKEQITAKLEETQIKRVKTQ